MLAFVLGVLVGLIGWCFSDDFFRLLGAAPDIIPDGSAYLKISLLGGFTVFILFIGNAALQGAGDTMTPMWIMAISNVLNIVLAPLFIFGLGPIPRMGVEGAAVATVISQAVAAGVAVHILLSGKARLHIRPHHWKPNLQLLVAHPADRPAGIGPDVFTQPDERRDDVDRGQLWHSRRGRLRRRHAVPHDHPDAGVRARRRRGDDGRPEPRRRQARPSATRGLGGHLDRHGVHGRNGGCHDGCSPPP